MSLVYLCIRDLESFDGPEVDVFEDPDDAKLAADATRGIYQEQSVFGHGEPVTKEFLEELGAS